MGSDPPFEVMAAVVGWGGLQWDGWEAREGCCGNSEGDSKAWMRVVKVQGEKSKDDVTETWDLAVEGPPEISWSAGTVISDRNNEAQGGSGLQSSHTANRQHSRLSNLGPMTPNTEQCLLLVLERCGAHAQRTAMGSGLQGLRSGWGSLVLWGFCFPPQVGAAVSCIQPKTISI